MRVAPQITVGGLTPRRTRQWLVHNLSGQDVEMPRPFVAGARDFTDYEWACSLGMNVIKRGGLLMVYCLRYTCPSATHEQITAHDHASACAKLDKTSAGNRASELLMRYLTDEQRMTAERYRYFDEWVLDDVSVAWQMAQDKPPVMTNVRVRFIRGFPNGNMHLKVSGGKSATLCLHPPSPYPTDDILLAQLMKLRTDPNGFINEANVTRGRTLYRLQQLFSDPPAPKQLIL